MFDYEFELLFHCEFDFECDYELELLFHFLKLQTSNICERWSVFPRPPRPPTSTYTRDLDRPGINTGQLIKRSLPASACTRSKRPTMSDRFARLGAINAPLNTRYNTFFSPCEKCQRARDSIMSNNRGISSNFRSPRNSFAETEAEDGALVFRKGIPKKR
ncbi:unnamed protein product [Nesidiocoris tenuis]|uniref:Uncharacterized protein n=1 Tax=Nesidiocoris tenuis TaxID=355587 RepID=A0A6H5GGW3_9HEMI|nr:unnamed protein product [Nesidiocoris tenuis]